MIGRSNACVSAILCCAVVAIAGCQGTGKLRNPFAKKKEPEAAPAVAASDTPGSSITQAGFDQPTPPPGSQYSPPPGTSVDEPEEKDFVKRVQDSLKSENIEKKYKKMMGRAPDETVARKAYAEGQSAFDAKNYDEAAKQFHIAEDRWPDSVLQEDAMFWEGESFFFGDHYSKASDVYVKLLKKYENSRYLDRISKRCFAIGQYWDEIAKKHWTYAPNFVDKTRPMFDSHGHAISQYEGIRLNDPTGPLADDATFAAAVSHFLAGHYEEADHSFDTLRKEYPRSDHQVEAHLLGLRAKLRNYQGAEYDERPLTEADKLIDSTMKQFADDMPEERERLQRAQRGIRAQRAEREYADGEYYDKRKCYGAARFYYANVIKQFPDTQHAQLAQARLEVIKDYPADPPNYWGWLGKIFGEREKGRRYSR